MFDFTVGDFPLTNLNDLIMVPNILSNVDVSIIAEANIDVFVLQFGHIKPFLDLD